MNKIRCVVFDMDGLMFNTEQCYWEAATELLARRHLRYTRELNDAIMGRPPEDCFKTIIRWHGLQEDWRRLMAESQQLFLSLLDKHLEPMPGLFELLEALERAAVPKAICTSSTRVVLEAILGPFHLEPRFQFTLTAEDVTRGKPDPEIYRKAAERFGVPAAQMLVLEDSQTGCQSAAAAGAVVVAVPGQHSCDQDFSVARLVLHGLTDRRLYDLLNLQPPPRENGGKDRPNTAPDDATAQRGESN